MNHRTDVDFDEDDKNLFQVDDPRLRADALKHSVLPRLHIVMNESIALIQRIYGIDVLEDSNVGYYPQFRTKRDKELKLLYEEAGVDFVGKRTSGKWVGVQRRDRKPVQILPYRYGFGLSYEGFIIGLTNTWLKGLARESQKKLFDFHVEHEALVHILSNISGIHQLFFWQSLALEPSISNLKQYYDYNHSTNTYDNDFLSEPIPYPISSEHLFGKTYALSKAIWSLTLRFACFYPVYDSYLQIAQGEPVRIQSLVDSLKHELSRIIDEEEDYPDDTQVAETQDSESLTESAKQAAENMIKVMPALRWQVFQRDNWKCVACGRGSADGIILHVDHIVPRSKGGSDDITNLQTLCHLCNIGKSNKDSTDLRHNP